MSNQRPNTVRRNPQGSQPMAIPSMARRRGPSCFGVGLGIALMAAILVVLLMMLDILPSPFDPKPTPTTAPLPTVTPVSVLETLPATATLFVPTDTTEPTQTPTSTATPTPEPTATPSPTPTEKPMTFVVRGTPTAYVDFIHSPRNCDYVFVGGEVWDLQEAPVFGARIILGGLYGESTIEMEAESGDVSAYGRSGFEFAIPNQNLASSSVYIQMVDDAGEALSSRTPLPISDSCEQNLIIVNFKQVR